MSVYGPLGGADQIRDRVRDHLILWMPAYVAEVARQRGLPPSDLPVPASLAVRNDTSDLPAFDQLPAVHVICEGLQARLAHADGAIDATATIQVRVYAAGVDEDTASRNVAAYLAAVRGAVMQHRDLSGLATTSRWAGEAMAEPVPGERRDAWGSGGAVVFEVDVAALVNVYDGPVQPPADPLAAPGDTPTSATVTTTLRRL